MSQVIEDGRSNSAEGGINPKLFVVGVAVGSVFPWFRRRGKP